MRHALALIFCAACGSPDAPDAGIDAAVRVDAGRDAAIADAGVVDAGIDAGGFERPIYDDTRWPTEGTLSSAFGPRLRSGVYDFHRGIDIAAPAGTPVVAFADGTLHSVSPEGSAAYPNGGNVVVLRHVSDAPIPLHDGDHTEYWTFYLHLEAFSAELLALSPGDEVPAGFVLGGVGRTGATYDHLHFEVRIGTWCSIEYQLANPTSSCAIGFDPHVNPLRFLPYDDADGLAIEVLAGSPPSFRVTSPRDELDFDELIVVRGETTLRLDFEDRAGIPPDDRDNDRVGGFFVEPEPFNASATIYEVRFTAEALDGWDRVEARDIWGKRVGLDM